MFHLGWFMGSGFSVQTWALDPWAGNTGHDWMKGDLFVDLAASLERARFDYLLVEDTSMVEDAYGRSMETTLKYGMLAPKCDPVPLIPLLTQRTKHIGIAVTLSTSFYHPFMAARTMTTLDHLTDGRVGLNVVTGSSSRAAHEADLGSEVPIHLFGLREPDLASETAVFALIARREFGRRRNPLAAGIAGPNPILFHTAMVARRGSCSRWPCIEIAVPPTPYEWPTSARRDSHP